MFNKKEYDLKTFLIIFFVALLFYYPVIYGSGFYADDVFRVNVSRKGFGWHYLGRHLATTIAQLYSNSRNLIVDASPLGWLASVALMAASAKLIYLKLNLSLQRYALPLALVFLINPFFIQNFLYRYDNLGMMLGLFFSVLAFALQDSRRNYPIKILLLLISLNFYQTFSNLYIALMAVLIILKAYEEQNPREIFRYFIYAFSALIICYVVYQIELYLTRVPSRAEFFPIELSSLYLILQNYFKALRQFSYFWSFYPRYLYIFIPIVIYALFSARLRVSQLLFLAFGLLLIFFSSLGFTALLKVPELNPRVLHYFSPLLMVVTIVLLKRNDKLKWVMLIPAVLCLLFSYRVGNMQKIQTAFEKPIAYNAAIDMAAQSDVKSYRSIGHIPYSNFIKNIKKETPFNGFMSRSSWITTGILNEYVPNGLLIFEWHRDYIKSRAQFYDQQASMDLLVDRAPFYKIYKHGDEGWIIWQSDF